MKNVKGFSLVEILIAMTIIGVLGALAMPNLLGYLDKSKQVVVDNHAGQSIP